MTLNYKSKNFTLKEIIHRLDDFPDKLIPLAMYQMGRLQALRDGACEFFKKEVRITITSGYRSPEYNNSLDGASADSHHIWRIKEDGSFVCANDLYSSDVPLKALYAFIKTYTQGEECYLHRQKRFIHLSAENRLDENWVI